ncbi:MAG: hypothetical protein ABEK84_05320 [Salinibacter sp.]
MDTNTIILLVEALVIVALSSYVWLSAQGKEEITTLQWALVFLLVLFLIGFAVTMFFNPLAMG